MCKDIVSALNSIDFVNRLAKTGVGYIGNLVIKVRGRLTIDNALIVRNILLLLNSAGRLKNITRPINIANWIFIQDKDYKEEVIEAKHSDDAVDALRYAVGIDFGLTENKIDIKDINSILNKEKADTVFEDRNIDKLSQSRLPSYIPQSFKDNLDLPDSALSEKYNKSRPTIRRWRRLVENEFSK